jgi:PadR family transcriptional regulator, regulatory protein AphA
MSINYAILGILSYRPMTGYDLKKIIQDSVFMHWSGNNNQIYKALTELHDNRLVINTVELNENSPTKKIYSITNEGLKALKEWVLSPAEPNEIKKPFLIRLAWSMQLNTSEITRLLDQYEDQIKMQLLMEQRKSQDASFLPDRTQLESTIWEFINDNIQRTYENELKWLNDLRNAISHIPNQNDIVKVQDNDAAMQVEANNKVMSYVVKDNIGLRYIFYNDFETKLETEKNILSIITALAENNTQFVLLDSEILSKEFQNLNNGLVASMLQKFTMYQIKSAIIVKDLNSFSSEFIESFTESGKNNILRIFASVVEAEKWFLELKKMEKI